MQEADPHATTRYGGGASGAAGALTMRILVTGAKGMLGHDIVRAAERSGDELALVDLPELDITDAAAVEAMLTRLGSDRGGLDGIINCAAWTDVDGAESK